MSFELLLVLSVIAASLVTVARRLGIAYPILLVIGGGALGFLPGAPRIVLSPEVVLVVFLPPLVFAAAWETPIRDLREDIRPVLLLSVGLVLFTAAVVAGVAIAILPGLSLAVALVLGAIVSPSDAIAATTVLERLPVPRRLRALLEEESLVNDATALSLYRSAVAAAVSGAFVLTEALGLFAVATIGGLIVGIAVAFIADLLFRWLHDPPVETSLSVVIPYAAYLPADHIGASGVIAAVTAGLILGYRSPRILAPSTRVLASSVWQILTFALNGFAFLLLGLELPALLATLGRAAVADLIARGIIVSLAVVVARFVWVYGAWYGPSFVARVLGRSVPEVQPSVPLVVSWAGMRGAVSLAAALALPTDFPGRDALLVITFVVIAVTLLGQGLTFPLLLRRVPISGPDEELREEMLARVQATLAALSVLEQLRARWPDHEPLLDLLEERYRHRLAHLPATADPATELEAETLSLRDRELEEHRAIRDAVIRAERETVIALRDRGEINDAVLRRIERELDLEELRLGADL